MVPWAVAQSFSFAVLDREHVAAAHGLGLAGIEHAGAGDQRITDGRTQVVDLVFRGDYAEAGQGATAGIGQRVVGQVADRAAMDEAVLLQVVAAHRQGQFGATGLEGGEFRAEQDAEGLLGQDALSELQQVGVWCPFPDKL
jgi:hypothetical protein